MPSPFPGMNPYLERSGVWEMFHTQLIAAMQPQLAAQVRPAFVVTIGTRMYVRRPRGQEHRFLGAADLGVHDPAAAAAGTAAATVAPAYGTFPKGIRVRRRRFLEIRTRGGLGVVTAVELLSPGNKRGGGDYKQYLRKRWEVMRSQTHLVELDLLRRGGRLPMGGVPAADYCGMVCRVEERPRVGFWPWNLRDPMPRIPVPLGQGYPDAWLDIKPLIDRIYDDSFYADTLYDEPPEPPLDSADAAWAAQFLPTPPAPPEAPA